MYQQPRLIEVGKAEDVILGILALGGDLDCTGYPIGLEFEEDQDGDSTR